MKIVIIDFSRPVRRPPFPEECGGTRCSEDYGGVVTLRSLVKMKAVLKEPQAGIDHLRIIQGAPVLRDLFEGPF